MRASCDKPWATATSHSECRNCEDGQIALHVLDLHCEKQDWSLYTHTHPFNGSFSGTTQVNRYQEGKPIWILLKQETVSGSGISWAICKSAPCSKQTPCQHPTTRFFTGRMPFLPPNQQRQSTEGYNWSVYMQWKCQFCGWLQQWLIAVLNSKRTASQK